MERDRRLYPSGEMPYQYVNTHPVRQGFIVRGDTFSAGDRVYNRILHPEEQRVQGSGPMLPAEGMRIAEVKMADGYGASEDEALAHCFEFGHRQLVRFEGEKLFYSGVYFTASYRESRQAQEALARFRESKPPSHPLHDSGKLS